MNTKEIQDIRLLYGAVYDEELREMATEYNNMITDEDFEVDMFDYILEYLVSEGYADTNQNAIKIMVNMSEEWKSSIIEAAYTGGSVGRDAMVSSNIARATAAKSPVARPTTSTTSTPAQPTSGGQSSTVSRTTTSTPFSGTPREKPVVGPLPRPLPSVTKSSATPLNPAKPQLRREPLF